MEEANHWSALGSGLVRCELCCHFCRIQEGSVGICGVRKNLHGSLMSLNYGKLISANLDPIEKKPLYHFLPGSRSYSIAATGCNLRCAWCQNWSISQTNSNNHPDRFETISPESVVRSALRSGAKSISYTYTEPTVFYEYVLDVSQLAKESGLRNVWVSNGYMSRKMLDEYLPWMDAINVDIKAFNEQVHRKYTATHLNPILENCERIKSAGVWIEVTTLLVPALNDDEDQIEGLAAFISEKLGNDTPWHVSRFYPQEQFDQISATDPATIHHALAVGKQAGLKFVYAGNLGTGEDSFCPSCGELLIARNSIWLMEDKLVEGKCPNCSTTIAGVWV